MTALETAIVTAFKGNAALLAAAVGGIHNTVATSGTAYPYVVFQIPAIKQTKTFSHDSEEIIMQFKIYTRSSSSSSLNDIWDKLTTVFDGAQLSMSGYTMVKMLRDVSIKTKDETDEQVWIYLVSYQILIEED